ncbi:MAG TPA: FAD-dependent oxidoreductase [Pyrinomonadaceae bacterium]|nr:FAD-dependent oxidoreductase [Pyrinomonadaceae bacterium]
MHDVLIIGAGPAGLATALWCDQLGLDVLVLERRTEIGGQLHSIYGPIENYPGLRAPDGKEFLKSFSAGSKDADFDLWTEVEIAKVDLPTKRVFLESGEELQAICIVIATGVRRRRLDIPGELEFIGKGIIESGARDRDLYAGKDVCVIGGGDAAVENALLLSEVCATVTLVNRGRKLRARREFTEQLGTNHCITVFKESVATRILGSSEVEAVEILRKDAIKPFQMAVKGVLVRIGVEPNSDFFGGQLEMDDQNYIVVSNKHETSITNVFAVGDISNPAAPTILSAAGAGATAAKVIAARLNSNRA